MTRFALRPPKPASRFGILRGRLALFHGAHEDKAFWSEYWLGDHTRSLLGAAAKGSLDSGFDVFSSLISRYVPSGGTVLEAGCGPGHAVAALRARGYAATGVDYVPELVACSKQLLPGLDIRVGDVEELPFESASFDCYASLGVIEHFEHGPEKAIAEAFRVTKPGGVAIFEVPFLNALRAGELARLSRHASDTTGLAFHQYYYSVLELATKLEAAGFRVMEQIPNCWEGVVFREHPVVARWWASRLAIGPLRGPVRRLVAAMPARGRLRYGHTIALPCRRP